MNKGGAERSWLFCGKDRKGIMNAATRLPLVVLLTASPGFTKCLLGRG